MRILVTGANGYLGQGIIKKLLDDNNEIIAADLFVDNVDKRAVTKASNIFEIDDPFVFYCRPDVVVHLAWRNGFEHFSDSHIIDLPSHYLFLKKLILSGCKRIAVMGTMHEVGFYEGCVDENTPCNPLSLYGIAKNSLRQSMICLCNRYGAKIQWLRGFYMVGNVKKGNSVFSKIAQAEEKGDSFFPFTSGLNKYDFIDYDDFCMKTASVIEQEEINGIINICSGTPETLRSRVESFIRDNNYRIKLKYGEYPDRPYDSKAIWGDNTKINQIMLLKSNVKRNKK